MQSLGGRYGVLLAAVLLAVGLAAGAVYLATLADTTVADELLPAGTYDSIDEAQRATGFKIPHARQLNGFRLEKIEVEGPEYGIIGEGEDAEFANLRAAKLTYQLGSGQRRINVTIFRTDSNELQAVQGAGPTEDTTVAGHKAMLQQSVFTGGRATMAFAQWLDGDLLVVANAFLVGGLLASGQVVEPGLTLEEFLALLNSFD